MNTASAEWMNFVAFCASATTCTEDCPEATEPQVRTIAEARELRDRLEQRVAELPEVCRLAVGLHFCGGYGLDEMCEILEVSRRDMEWLFDKALRAIREPRAALEGGVNHG
jgi:DNA-directed RNA polymerase specialized sigma24 family protein